MWGRILIKMRKREIRSEVLLRKYMNRVKQDEEEAEG